MRNAHTSIAMLLIACTSIAVSCLSAQGEDPASIYVPQSFPTPSEIIERKIQESAGQQDLYRNTCNSVVKIQKIDAVGTTQATGFFIDQEGLIATVIATNSSAETITVTWQERMYPAKLLALDPKTRMALMRIDATGTPPLKLSRGFDVPIGAAIYAVSDTAEAAHRITAGKLAGRESSLQKHVLPTTILRLHMKTVDDAFGAPVLDSDGRVAAVLLLSIDEESEVCFALPSEILHKVWNDFGKFGNVEQSWLGFTLEMGTSTPKVVIVQNDSPADSAGLLQHDVIMRIGDRPIRNYQDVVDKCYYLTAGQEVEVQVLRGIQERTVLLTPKAVSELVREKKERSSS